MPVFAVSYDLHKSNDYSSVHKAIEEHEHCWILESFCLVEHPENAEDLRDQLWKVMGKDDKLFVIKVAGNWGSANLSQVSECIRELV